MRGTIHETCTHRHPIPVRLQIAHAAAEAAASASGLGNLPTWNLGDLYPSHDSDDFRNDLRQAGTEAAAFQAKWKGNLSAACGKSGDEGLGQALAEFEALEERIGRIGSFAGLYYYGDMTDPAKGKFFSDTSARITEIAANLLFFALRTQPGRRRCCRSGDVGGCEGCGL